MPNVVEKHFFFSERIKGWNYLLNNLLNGRDCDDILRIISSWIHYKMKKELLAKQIEKIMNLNYQKTRLT